MIEFLLHDIRWNADLGQSFLILLERGADRYLAVAASPEDARALSPAASSDCSCSHRLLEAALRALEARLVSVKLAVAPEGRLLATLHLATNDGLTTLPAHFANAILLARRNAVALLIDEGSLGRAPEIDSLPDSADASAARIEPVYLAPYRDLIAGLDLDGFGGGGCSS